MDTGTNDFGGAITALDADEKRDSQFDPHLQFPSFDVERSELQWHPGEMDYSDLIRAGVETFAGADSEGLRAA